jgi:molybdopterin-binding protein
MSLKLTRAQVAQSLQITTKTLAAWEKAGKIPAAQRDVRGWRVYDEAAIATIRAALGLDDAVTAQTPFPELAVSARNRLVGVIKEISGDGILCEVVLDLGNGQEIVSVITRSSVQRLGLKAGVRAYALIKSTEVMIAR